MLGRAINIFGLGFVLNTVRKKGARAGGRARVPAKYQAVMFHAGLRGAIAFAVAWRFPDRYGHREAVIGTTTMVRRLSSPSSPSGPRRLSGMKELRPHSHPRP